jgi:Tfp pilus assembly protein FimT
MVGRSGISVLELVIVLAVGSVVLGVTALSHRAVRPRLDLSMAARQVAMDLKLTRMRAITEHLNHRLVFADGASAYQRQRKTSSSYADDGGRIPLPAGVVIADCTAAGGAITFRPRGNAESFGTITLHNARGDQQQVVVDIAGQVRVQ